MLVLKLLADLFVLGDDLLQRVGKGQQLVQVGGAGKQRDRAAVVEALHGFHAALEILPALVVLGLLLVNLLLLLVNLVLLVDDLTVQVTDLLGQVVDLAQYKFTLLFQLRLLCLGVGLVALGVFELLVEFILLRL